MTSFISLANFYFLNDHPLYGDGELGLEHFLYYYQPARSSGSNQPRGKRSPKKDKGKAKVGEAGSPPKKKVKGTGKGNPIRDTTDPDFYKKWLIK